MTSKITEVRTDDAPDPLGPYSQAVLAGNTLYCSGNIAIDPKTGEIVGDGDVQEETRQVLKNMDAVLKKGGASAENVVRCTVFLDDLQNFVSFLRCRIKRERFFSFAMSVFAHPSSSITYYLYLLSGCRQWNLPRVFQRQSRRALAILRPGSCSAERSSGRNRLHCSSLNKLIGWQLYQSLY